MLLYPVQSFCWSYSTKFLLISGKTYIYFNIFIGVWVTMGYLPFLQMLLKIFHSFKVCKQMFHHFLNNIFWRVNIPKILINSVARHFSNFVFYFSCNSNPTILFFCYLNFLIQSEILESSSQLSDFRWDALTI